MELKDATDSLFHKESPSLSVLRDDVKRNVRTTRIPSITPKYEEKDAILTSLREEVKSSIKNTKVPTIDPFEDKTFVLLNGQRVSSFIKESERWTNANTHYNNERLERIERRLPGVVNDPIEARKKLTRQYPLVMYTSNPELAKELGNRSRFGDGDGSFWDRWISTTSVGVENAQTGKYDKLSFPLTSTYSSGSVRPRSGFKRLLPSMDRPANRIPKYVPLKERRRKEEENLQKKAMKLQDEHNKRLGLHTNNMLAWCTDTNTQEDEKGDIQVPKTLVEAFSNVKDGNNITSDNNSQASAPSSTESRRSIHSRPNSVTKNRRHTDKGRVSVDNFQLTTPLASPRESGEGEKTESKLEHPSEEYMRFSKVLGRKYIGQKAKTDFYALYRDIARATDRFTKDEIKEMAPYEKLKKEVAEEEDQSESAQSKESSKDDTEPNRDNEKYVAKIAGIKPLGSFPKIKITSNDTWQEIRIDPEKWTADQKGEMFDDDIYSHPLSSRSSYLQGCIDEKLCPNASVMIRSMQKPGTLDLSHKGVGDQSMNVLAPSFALLPGLREIVLRDNNLTDESLPTVINTLKKIPELISLDLSDNKVDEEGSDALYDYLSNFAPKLKKFGLSRADVDDIECEKFISAITACTNITDLDMSKNLIGTKEVLNVLNPDFVTGAEAIAEALEDENSKIERLDISWNYVRLGSAVAIGDSLRGNTTLQTLVLDYNCIGEDGCEALGRSLMFNNTLTSLSVACNSIGPRAAFTLAIAIKKHNKLTYLNIAGNPIGEIGGRELLSLCTWSNNPPDLEVKGCNFKYKNSSCWFQPDNPTRSINVDLKEPYSRAVVESLLQSMSVNRQSNTSLIDMVYTSEEGTQTNYEIERYVKDETESLLQLEKGAVVTKFSEALSKFNNELEELALNDPEAAIAKGYIVKSTRMKQKKSKNRMLMDFKNKSKIKKKTLVTPFDKDDDEESYNDEESRGSFEDLENEEDGEINDDDEEKEIENRLLPIEIALNIGQTFIHDLELNEFERAISTYRPNDFSKCSLENVLAAMDIIITLRIQQSASRPALIVHKGTTKKFDLPEEGKFQCRVIYERKKEGIEPVNGAGQLGAVLDIAYGVASKMDVLNLACPGLRLQYKDAMELFSNIAQDYKDKVEALTNLLPQVSSPAVARDVLRDTMGIGEFSINGRLRLKSTLGPAYAPIFGVYSGSYEVDLAKEIHKVGVEQLLAKSNSENKLRRMCGYYDTSQYGDWSNFRNVTLNGKLIHFNEEIWDKHIRELPGGSVKFDYIATQRPSDFVEAENDSDVIEFLLSKQFISQDDISYVKNKLRTGGTKKEFTKMYGRATSWELSKLYGDELPTDKALLSKIVYEDNINGNPEDVGYLVRTQTKNKLAIPDSMSKEEQENTKVEEGKKKGKNTSGKQRNKKQQDNKDSNKVGAKALFGLILLLKYCGRFKSGVRRLLRRIRLAKVADAFILSMEDYASQRVFTCKQASYFVSHAPQRRKCNVYPAIDLRLDLAVLLFSRIKDIENFQMIRNIFEPEQQAELIRRIGYLNLSNTSKPDGFIELCLARREERQLAKVYMTLDGIEPGKTWVGTNYKKSRFTTYAAGWMLPQDWRTEDLLPWEGYLSFQYYSGSGKGLLGCRPNQTLRNALSICTGAPIMKDGNNERQYIAKCLVSLPSSFDFAAVGMPRYISRVLFYDPTQTDTTADPPSDAEDTSEE